MLKKIIAAAAVGTMLLIAGCGKEKTTVPKEINITYVKAPLNIPSILEKNKDMFGKEFSKDGITVKFHELTTGPEQTQALAAGELDFLHALGGTSAIIAASNGVDLKITNIYSRSPKGFMLISKSADIKEPKDLVGKKVAGPKGTILHQLLLTYLGKDNLKVDDIEFINMGLPEAMAALESGNVDAALLAGPVALKAIKNGASVVTNGEGLVEGIVVTAVSGKFLKENPQLVERFLKVNEDAVKFIKDDFETTLKITAEDTGLSKDEVMELYPLYDFNTEIKASDVEDLVKTQDFLIENGLQEKKIDINTIIKK